MRTCDDGTVAGTYDADARLEVCRHTEAVEELPICRVVELHLVQLENRGGQLLKVIWKPANDKQLEVFFSNFFIFQSYTFNDCRPT